MDWIWRNNYVGVHISYKGAIVASNALFTGDVPPYAIYGGIPAKIIKYRFDKEIIDELMKIDFIVVANTDFGRKNIDKIYIPHRKYGTTGLDQRKGIPK